MGSETKNGVGVAAAQFPPTTRKIIQSLKEIVNCPEPEIYSVLKECNMDPSDAVQRLLSLDTFHEVKSKRERRKEIKETQDTKSRVHNAGSNCGARSSSERTDGWCGSTQTSSNELGKAAYKGQNGFVAPSPHTSASHFTGGTTSQQRSSQHESFSTSIRPGDAVSASLQPYTGNQSTYGTSLGNLSMADIVKMGRQPSMGSRISSDTSSHQDAFSTYSWNSHVESSQTEMHQYMHSHNPRVSEMLHKTGNTAGHNDFHDEWRVIEQPTAANRSSALNANQSKFYINESNVPRDYQSHKVQESEGNISSESVSSDCNAFACASSRQKMADASGGKSYCVDDLSSNSSSYESHRSAYENGEGTGIGSNASYPNHSVSNDVAVASATVRMQQLNLRKDEDQDNCAVVLPNNLQELAADCSHLSFGTFRPAQSSASSTKPSNSLKNDLGGSSAGIDVFSAGRLDTRNSGYNHDELLGSLYDTRRAAIGYDLPVPSQREPIKQDILEATRGYRDITTSSLHNFNSEKIEKATSGLPFAKADPEFINVPKNDMAYSDSVQSDLLESFQQFLVKPPVPSRYSSAVSSVNNPTISTSEVSDGGTPRRHLLTTGWSAFVNQKKLVAGDSIVFLRAENGDLCVGIRRAKRGLDGGGGNEVASGWNNSHSSGGGSGGCFLPYGGFSVFLREEDNKMRNGSGNLSPNGNMRGKGRVRPESVVEAATMAANGQPFEVVYYPRASTPEFCVKTLAVRAAMRVQWCSGMRFKMAFETEDSSRISWFMGTVSSVQVANPICWPNSPWRLLQVTWDEPDLLQNVKCVSPWLIELVSNYPMIHMPPFSPPRKKLRLLQHPDFSLDGQLTLPSFSGNPLGPSSPLCCLPNNTPAGIQGARHAQFRISLSDLHLNNKLQSGLFSSSFQRFNQSSGISNGIRAGHTSSNENLSCLLTMGNSSQNSEKPDNVKKHKFLLFGQPILTEQQISRSCSSEAVSQLLPGKNSKDGNQDKTKFFFNSSESALGRQVSLEKSTSAGFSWHKDFRATDFDLETGHCKVFMESEDVGRTLDLSALCSYEDLYRRLANMFGIEKPDMMSHVLYRDVTGSVKQTGVEPFSDFTKTAKRLTIITHPASESIGRTWIRGMQNAENGLGATNKTGPLSIFA